MNGIDVIALAKVVVPWLLAGGAAFGGVKAGLNGQKERLKAVDEKVEAIDDKLDTHIKEDFEVQTTMVEGLTRVETKLDSFIEFNRD